MVAGWSILRKPDDRRLQEPVFQVSGARLGINRSVPLDLAFLLLSSPMPYTPIVATLGYVLSPDRSEVLMIHRNARPDDQHLGKYNGLGGKMEPGEDIAACMRREILEEAGITCESMQLRGTLNWPGFGKHGEDWLGFIFLIDRYAGMPLQANAEGTLEWVALQRLMTLPMWEGDRHFLPLVFDADPRPFHGVMPYRDGRMQSWSFTRL
jgi:8-oxo-dGTP diphosphatase